MARLMFTFTLFQLSLGHKVYVKYISLYLPELNENFNLLMEFQIYRRSVKQLV